MIKKIQTILDTKFYPDVYAFHLKSADIPNMKEYIVYSIGSFSDRSFADDLPLINTKDITLTYFYQIKDKDAEARAKEIIEVMRNNGFETTTGAFDLGDIDETGFNAIGMEFSYSEVV